jgi:hypothetical protein
VSRADVLRDGLVQPRADGRGRQSYPSPLPRRDPDGLRIVGYLEHQFSAEQVHKRRADTAKRQREYKSRRAAGGNGAGNTTADATSSASVTAPLPDPTRPDPQGGSGKGEGRTLRADPSAGATGRPARNSEPARYIVESDE